MSQRRYAHALFAVIIFSLLTISTIAAQERALTIEKIMSAPFPYELSAAPSNNRVAWVQNAQGVRNIWTASAPDFRGRQVTNYAKEDGQEISGLAWTPDAATILFVRGGSANRQGESPNPALDPAGVEQSVWRVSINGGEPVRVGAGSDPLVSPRGELIVFTRRGQVFSASLDGKSEPAQLFRVRGGAASLRFSPDGTKIAFVSDRGEHSFVGVYDVNEKSLRYIDPTVDSDSEPSWSPDGAQLAFLRVPASSQLNIFRSVRSARPWSIQVVKLATNESRTIWRAREGRGSAFWPINAENQLLWAAGDRIVFPHEGDGWLHLYSVAARGGEAVLLTPGEFEVEYASLSPDRRQIIFNSNQGDIDRRHLWRVGVAENRPVAITRGEGIEWSPVMTSDGRALCYLRSGARRPARAAIQIGTAEARDLAPDTIPADYPERALVEPQPVTFTASDGMQIHAQLFTPPDMQRATRRPALLFLHGGSRRQMLLGWHYLGYYNNAYAMNQYLALRGYIVLAINFRSGIGYGMEFREATNYGAGGASEFNDVLGAGLYLRSRPDVDARRIGLWGGSYGGYLTAMGLARASDLFAAGVDFHGVHDWNVGIRTFVPSYNTLERVEDARLAFQSSPMASLATWRSPVLLIHGDDDRNVSFAETVTLVERLRERNVEVEQLVFPDEVHSFLLHSNWVKAYRATADFFDRKLQRRDR